MDDHNTSQDVLTFKNLFKERLDQGYTPQQIIIYARGFIDSLYAQRNYPAASNVVEYAQKHNLLCEVAQ